MRPAAVGTDTASPVHRDWAGVLETHIGVVFFAGDLAYKLKKPVDFGFLDFTRRETRREICHREVELNRRLAPDVYLGVADVTGPDGEVCDHLIVMRRMPGERRLATLVRHGGELTGTITGLARIMTRFHAGADRSTKISAAGTRDALRGRWRDSFAQVREFAGTLLDPAATAETERLAEEFLAGREALFEHRIAAGHIVDGHGDLLADDIFCLDDGPRILDCLEFDDRLRWVDGLDDVAFLAMDLERLGAEALGEHLLDRYLEFAGDPAPPALRHHYLAYRAFVRTKVACLRSAQGDTESAALARHYAGITLRHLRLARVRLVLVGGLPGSGKSTLAGAIADRLGATLLSSDRIRKEQAGMSPEQDAGAGYEQGIYDAAHTARTYAELNRRAAALLALGETVVLDASWRAPEYRNAAVGLGTAANSQVVPLLCWAPETITSTRLAARGPSVSDATPALAHRMAATVPDWADAHTVFTAGTEEESLTQALAYLE